MRKELIKWAMVAGTTTLIILLSILLATTANCQTTPYWPGPAFSAFSGTTSEGMSYTLADDILTTYDGSTESYYLLWPVVSYWNMNRKGDFYPVPSSVATYIEYTTIYQGFSNEGIPTTVVVVYSQTRTKKWIQRLQLVHHK